uniref:(California timema) hypothetical protein n=1 Tax=Timema californicum TaxID=61474 RepID=A0A7R9JBE2_TIMCA|nr:unnamed protein product [Timema californicum]
MVWSSHFLSKRLLYHERTELWVNMTLSRPPTAYSATNDRLQLLRGSDPWLTHLKPVVWQRRLSYPMSFKKQVFVFCARRQTLATASSFLLMILFSNGMCAVILLLLSETTTTHSQIYAFCLYRSGFCQQNYVRPYVPSNKYALREGSSSENMTRTSESYTHIIESLSYISFPENHTDEINNSSRIKESATIVSEESSRNVTSSGNIENVTRVTEISTYIPKQSQTPSTTMTSISTPTPKQSQTPSTTMTSISTPTPKQSQTPSTTMTKAEADQLWQALSEKPRSAEMAPTLPSNCELHSTQWLQQDHVEPVPCYSRPWLGPPNDELVDPRYSSRGLSPGDSTACTGFQLTGASMRHEDGYSPCGASGWKCKQNSTIKLTPYPLRNPLCGLEEHLPEDGQAMEEGK